MSSSLSSLSTNSGVKYLNQDEAINLDKRLFDEYNYSLDQLMELAGLSVATAIAKSYPLNKRSQPVICCGPGNNGGDGLVAARHLQMFGYTPTIIYPKPGRNEIFQRLIVQCEKSNIRVLNSTKPGSLHELGDLIVDAIFGFSYKPPNRNSILSTLLKEMHECKINHGIPIVSVDIPSGWNVELGPINIDSENATVDEVYQIPILQPECLVSLTAPKMCAKNFTGLYHYLGGRFCPKPLADQLHLNLPAYPGHECVVQLNS